MPNLKSAIRNFLRLHPQPQTPNIIQEPATLTIILPQNIESFLRQIKSSQHRDSARDIMTDLKAKGVSDDNLQTIADTMIEQTKLLGQEYWLSAGLKDDLTALPLAGIANLAKAVIKQTDGRHLQTSIVEAITKLQKLGYSYSEFPELYEMTLRFTHAEDVFVDALAFLKKKKLSFKLLPQFYQHLATRIEDAINTDEKIPPSGRARKAVDELTSCQNLNEIYQYVVGDNDLPSFESALYSISASLTDQDIQSLFSKWLATGVSEQTLVTIANAIKARIDELDGNTLSLGFLTTSLAEIPKSSLPELATLVIKKASGLGLEPSIVEGYIELDKLGFNFANTPDMCHKLAALAYSNELTAEVFKLYAEHGYPYPKYRALYNLTIDEILNRLALSTVHPFRTFRALMADFGKLEEQGYRFSEDNIDNYRLLLSGGEQAIELIKLGFSLDNEAHRTIFEELGSDNSSMAVNNALLKYAESKINQGLDISEVTNNPAKVIKQVFDIDISEQSTLERLKSIITKANDNALIVSGPLNKTEPTRMLERLINTLITTDISAIEAKVNDDNEYELKLPNEQQPINLSLLLQNSNLSHLEISDSTAAKLGETITALMGGSIFGKTQPIRTSPMKKLPLASVQALHFYADGQRGYIDINRLFRGERLIGGHFKLSPDEANSPKNVLGSFMIGVLINDACKRLPLILDEPGIFAEEKRILHKIAYSQEISVREITASNYQVLLDQARADQAISDDEYKLLNTKYSSLAPLMAGYKLLVRREVLTPEAAESRALNALTLTALTSASQNMQGFGADAQTPSESSGQRIYETIFTNAPTNIFTTAEQSVSTTEAEVIIPPGTQVVNRISGDKLTATIVNSPQFQISDYWADLALRYANRHYLTTQYKDAPDAIRGNNTVLVRPNHGVAHTHRVMSNIQTVKQYFANYASDADFRDFCNHMSEQDVQLLKMATAFRVTGRESEIGFNDNPELYLQYRRRSAEHLEDFINTTNPMPELQGTKRELIVARLKEVVQYMGDPNYPEKNTGATAKERAVRNYLHRILSMSHDLDLARCRVPNAYDNDLAPFAEHVVASEEQHQAFIALKHYAIKLIKSHGGRTYCDISDNGETIDSAENGYNTTRFIETSQSFAKLYQRTNAVPTPRMTVRDDQFRFRYKDSFENAIKALQQTAFGSNDSELNAYIAQQTALFQHYFEQGDGEKLSDVLNEVWAYATALTDEPGLNLVREKITMLHESDEASDDNKCRVETAMAKVPLILRVQWLHLPEGNAAGQEVMAVRKAIAMHDDPSQVATDDNGVIIAEKASEMFQNYKQRLLEIKQEQGDNIQRSDFIFKRLK